MNTRCPACQAHHNQTHAKCPECEFGFQILDSYYTSHWHSKNSPRLRLITDHAGILNANERKMAKSILIDFSRRFPGLFFSVYLDSSRDHDESDSKSLWFLNKAEFTDFAAGTHPQYGIFLYLDANKKNAAVSYGDALVPYITAQDSFQFLKGGHPEFFRGRYLQGIKSVVKRASNHLVKSCPRS